MSRWSPFDPDIDRKLVRGLNESNEDTLIVLYDAYAERLYDYCVSLVGDSKVAADTVHDCLIDASRRAPRMRDRMRLRAWLYAAARRRCLQRGRSGGLHWEWVPDPVHMGTPEDDGTDERAPDDESGGEEDDGSGLSLDERRELLELTLARLDFPEQEALLLALRHEVTGSDLAATLGVSGRRAASRLARARSQADAAITAELRVLSWRYAEEGAAGASSAGRARQAEDAAAGQAEQVESAEPVQAGGTLGMAKRPEPLRPRRSLKTITEVAGKPAPATSSTRETGGPGRADQVIHADHRGDQDLPGRVDRSDRSGHDDRSADDWRDKITLIGLLDLAQAPAPPAALRRRVVHTATDPELAGYRADISGRGGNLTTQGLPRQPDVTPPFARRWMFAAGGMIGALATATVAILIIGPDLPGPQFYWPSGPQDRAPAPVPTQSLPNRFQVPPPGPADPGARHPVADAPQLDGRLTTPAPRPRTPRTPPRPGRLILGTTRIQLGAGERQTHINLSASHGPVTWNAVTSTPQLTLSATRGRISTGRTTRLDIVFQRGLIQLQGQATITFTSAGGRSQTATVTWAGSVLT